MLFKLSNLNSNLALTLGYLNPALNNPAQVTVGHLHDVAIFHYCQNSSGFAFLFCKLGLAFFFINNLYFESARIQI